MQRVLAHKRKRIESDRRIAEVSAVVSFFLSQRDIVGLIAGKITSTRRLISFMLHFCPELRAAYTTQRCWNLVFNLRRRIAETWGRRYTAPRNVLGMFVAWARHPTSCLAGCGGSKRTRERVCETCARCRVKHTSTELAAMRFRMWRGPVRCYYYVCVPRLPRRTLEEDLAHPELSGMVYDGDIMTIRDALQFCDEQGSFFNFDKHALDAWDYQGMRVALTTREVLMME
jgi:hypothetical protein